MFLNSLKKHLPGTSLFISILSFHEDTKALKRYFAFEAEAVGTHHHGALLFSKRNVIPGTTNRKIMVLCWVSLKKE